MTTDNPNVVNLFEKNLVKEEVKETNKPIKEADYTFDLFSGFYEEEQKMDQQDQPKEESCVVDDSVKKPEPKAAAGKGKSDSTDKTSRNKKATPPDIKVREDWKICHAFQTMLVGDVFDEPIAEEGATLDEVRDMLSKDYPEFSKDRTHWEYDAEQKLLFPIVKGTSKGVR